MRGVAELRKLAGVGGRATALGGKFVVKPPPVRRSGSVARVTQAPVESTARPPERSREAQEARPAEKPVETEARPPARTPKRPAATGQANHAVPSPLSGVEYRLLRLNWNLHRARAERGGISPYDLDGAAALIERIAEFAGNERVPAAPRQRLQALVDGDRAHVRTRTRVQILAQGLRRALGALPQEPPNPTPSHLV